MNLSLTSENNNKENDLPTLKPRQSQPSQRTFGTDITKTIIQLSPPDTQSLSYYASDILAYLQSIETLYVPKAGYLSNQPEVNEKMRSVLVDWLIEVHYRFKLTDETIYLTINLIDRYLELTPITRNRLQLVGVTSMLIASKYEDIYPPEVQDFINISDHAYTREQILEMERSILKQLKYSVTVPSPFRFLQMLCKVSCDSDENLALARYFLELSLVEYKMIKYSSSLKAAASIYLMHKFVKVKPEWPEELVNKSKFEEDELKVCAKDLCCLYQQAGKSSLKSVKNKFSGVGFYRVAVLNYI